MKKGKTLFEVVCIEGQHYERIADKEDRNGYFHSFKKAKQVAMNFVLKSERQSQSYVFKVIGIEENGSLSFKPTQGFLTMIEKGEDGFIDVYGNF